MILSAGLVAFAAIVGAAFGAGPLYRLRTAPVTGVAVPTAVGLLLISAGMFLERPGRSRAARHLARAGSAPLEAAGAARRRSSRAAGVRAVARVHARRDPGRGAAVRDSRRVDDRRRPRSLGEQRRAPRSRARGARREPRRDARAGPDAPDGIFVADLDGRYTDVNRAGCEMLGRARRKIVGKTIVDSIPRDVGRLAASKQHLLAGKAEVSEWRLRRKDGRTLPVELNAKISPTAAGRPSSATSASARRIEDERQSVRLADRELVGFHRHRGPEREADLSRSSRASHGRLAAPTSRWRRSQIVDCYPAEERAFAGDVILKTMSSAVGGQERLIFATGRPRAAIPVSDEHFIIRLIPPASGIWAWGPSRATSPSASAPRRRCGVGGEVLGDRLHLRRRDHLRRRGPANRDLQRRRGEHLRVRAAEAIGPLDVSSPKGFSVHRQHVAGFAAGPTTRALGERLPRSWAAQERRGVPGGGGDLEARVGGGRSSRSRSATSRNAEARREGAAVPGRGRLGAGDVARLRADAVEPGWLMVAIRRLVHRRHRGEREASRRLPVVGARASRRLAAVEQLPVDRRLPLLGRRAGTRAGGSGRTDDAEKLESIAQGDEHHRALHAIDPRSLMGVPLIVRGGLLGVTRPPPDEPSHTYVPEDLRMAQALAERAALAIENGRLYRPR